MRRLLAIWVGAAALLGAAAPASERIDRLNAAFVAHLDSLAAGHGDAIAAIRERYGHLTDAGAAEGFVPEALAEIYPEFRAALDAYDRGALAEAEPRFAELKRSDDPYVAASAAYFDVRVLAERGMFEEAEAALREFSFANDGPISFTPYAPHMALVLATCQAANLRFDDAARTLADLASNVPDAPEPVAFGAGQLRVEMDRRERGTLGEVSNILRYAGDRLRIGDSEPRVRERQDDAVEILDKLIENAEKQEEDQKKQQSGKGGRGRSGRGRSEQRRPQQPLEESAPIDGGAKTMDLHGVERADPGEMWGKMPPAEREKILQSLRMRFPSRYRQLVEQYYRSLAEQK